MPVNSKIPYSINSLPGVWGLLLILLLGSMKIQAQEADFSSSTSKAFPYQLSSYREAGLMALGTGVLYTGGFTQRILKPMDQNQVEHLDRTNIPGFDRFASYNWNPELNRIREFLEPMGVLASLGMIGGVGLQEKNHNYTWYPLMTLTMMYFEGFYLAEGSLLISKSLFKRARPYTYNPDLPMNERTASGNNESFFSGNATVMFFNATFISQVATDIFTGSKWLPYIWGGTHGIALLSGIWSVQSGMHFPSDIVAGAVLGTSMALLITRIHKSKNQRMQLAPWSVKDGAGISLIINPSSGKRK